MKMNKLFLAFSILSFSIQMPIKAAGLAYKPAALMAAASTAAAVLSNGVIAIADSIKNDKLADAQRHILHLDQALKLEQTKNSTANDSDFISGMICGCGLVVCMVVLAALVAAPVPHANDKAEIDAINA